MSTLSIEASKKVFKSRLKTIRRVGTSKHQDSVWLYQCECGNKVERLKWLVDSGKTKSCGCLRKEVTGNKKRTHGMSGNNRFYKIWRNMMERCTNPKANQWKDYGGRGIDVCKNWHSFESFKYDLHKQYQEHVSRFGEKNTLIDRSDNDKGYSPDNCRWVTRHESRVNSREPDKARRLTHDGITDTIQGWADRLGVKYGTLSARISRWPLERALTQKRRAY